MIQKELRPGVRLVYIPSHKFKSNTIAMTWVAPLERETASLNALLPEVLYRGCVSAPDMEAIASRQDELYGGSIYPMVRKRGEAHCVGFVGNFLDDIYAPGETRILEQAAELMTELLLRPVTEDGVFCREYVESERSNLLDRIAAQVNEKRSYALLRLIAEMCREEPYGVDGNGDAQHAAAITAESLWEQYQQLLGHAPMVLYYSGAAELERVERALSPLVGALPEGQRLLPGRPTPHAAPAEPRWVEEALDVTQGKLCIGFRSGGSLFTDNYPAVLVANALFGGTSTSKLFLNVREKRSLCYYASSMLEKINGLMMVSSGVEFDQMEAARTEIFAQLSACQKGEFEEWELEGARRSVISDLKAWMDGQGYLESFWLTQVLCGQTESPAELARRLERVTREEVVEAARGFVPDTIYFLKGKEGA